MQRDITINIAPTTALSDILALKDVLTPLCASVTLSDDLLAIRISYDEDALRTLLGRNAGRLRIMPEKLTWEQALILKERGCPNAKIAELAGMSLRTFYRRRKEYLEGCFDNNDFI